MAKIELFSLKRSCFVYASTRFKPFIGVTFAENDVYQSTDTKALNTYGSRLGVCCVLDISTRKRNETEKKAPRHQRHPEDFSVSSFPRTRRLFMNSTFHRLPVWGHESPRVNIAWSQVSLDAALSSESSCVWGIFPSGEKGKTERSSTKTSLSCFFGFLSVITNYRLTRLLLKSTKREKKTWKKH